MSNKHNDEMLERSVEQSFEQWADNNGSALAGDAYEVSDEIRDLIMWWVMEAFRAGVAAGARIQRETV